MRIADVFEWTYAPEHKGSGRKIVLSIAMSPMGLSVCTDVPNLVFLEAFSASLGVGIRKFSRLLASSKIIIIFIYVPYLRVMLI